MQPLEEELLIACYRGQLSEVKKILSNGISPNFIGLVGSTPLIAAVSNNHVEVVEYLLGHGADINFSDPSEEIFSNTPLTAACHHGHLEMVRYLINKGVDVNQASKMFGSPLYAAIKKDSKEIAALLINSGASTELKHDSLVDVVICIAAKENNREMVQLLIEKGANTKPLRKMPRHKIPAGMVKFLKAKDYL